jgi:transposase-like protein
MATPELLAIPRSEDEARTLLEGLRWPDGPACPHCGGADPYRLTPRPGAKRPGRKGLLKCRACRKQFTVTVGTIFEDSHIPLVTWLHVIHLMSASKKGISAHQIHRMMGVTYKSAWFMCHRIRYAMTQEPLKSKLAGIVEVDETYVGGKSRGRGYDSARERKIPVMGLLERGGRVRAMVPVSGKNLKEMVREHVATEAHVMTDEFNHYKGLGDEFAAHSTVNHSIREYARGNVTTNTIEGFFALLKRGVMGTFHHISKRHMGRYLDEFTFRYDRRKMTDKERAVSAIKATEGKRLMLKQPVAQ